jgi:hypothetical protein
LVFCTCNFSKVKPLPSAPTFLHLGTLCAVILDFEVETLKRWSAYFSKISLIFYLCDEEDLALSCSGLSFCREGSFVWVADGVIGLYVLFGRTRFLFPLVPLEISNFVFLSVLNIYLFLIASTYCSEYVCVVCTVLSVSFLVLYHFSDPQLIYFNGVAH